jgi:hypothetical protein
MDFIKVCIKDVVYEVVPVALVPKKKNSGLMGSCELPYRDGICCFGLGVHKSKQNSVQCRMHGCMCSIKK